MVLVLTVNFNQIERSLCLMKVMTYIYSLKDKEHDRHVLDEATISKVSGTIFILLIIMV